MLPGSRDWKIEKQRKQEKLKALKELRAEKERQRARRLQVGCHIDIFLWKIQTSTNESMSSSK